MNISWDFIESMDILDIRCNIYSIVDYIYIIIICDILKVIQHEKYKIYIHSRFERGNQYFHMGSKSK